MSYTENAMLADRLDRFEALARHHQIWALARQSEADQRRRAPLRIAARLASLRLRVRRSLKGGRRSLA